MNEEKSGQDAAVAKSKTGRLLALDAMRGATILGMILVNNPGSWAADHLYGPLQHAAWHGWTPTDLVFPFFLFMVGVSMAYSFGRYERGETVDRSVWLRISRRVVVLVLLGLLLNASGRIFGVLLGSRDAWDLDTLRWPGVLQRIGLAYLGGSLIVLLCKPRIRLAVGAMLLIGYAAMLLLVPQTVSVDERLGPDENVVRMFDLATIGADHMYTRATSEPTDPEGLLSTLPSIVSVLLGYTVGRRLRGAEITAGSALRLLAAGVAVAAVGQAWGLLDPQVGGMPINKKIWTSSFVLLTAGLGTVCLSVCLLLFDLAGRRSAPLRQVAVAFQMVGVNAILVFVGSGLLARLLSMTHVGDLSTKEWLYRTAFLGPIGDPKLSSLAFALTTVVFWWLAAWGLWRMKWSLRV